MAQGFFTWSHTNASNASASDAINWRENQAPSSINDSARAQMAETAKWRDDISGATVTTGTSAAYSLTTFSNFTSAAYMANQLVAFTPHVTNAAGPVTLTVDSQANIPLRSSPGVELLAGVLIAGTPYCCVLNQADNALYLQSFYGSSPYLIPIGGMIDYIGSTTPGAAYAFPAGQAISRTTYATLFALIGTQYGAGDGTTTFNIIDMTGRVSAMKEASATRLTAAGFGGNSTVLGAVGGLEAEPLALGHLPTGITAANSAVIASTSTRSDIFVAPSGIADAATNTTGGANTRVAASTNASISSITSNIAIGAAAVTSNNTGSQAAGGAKNVPTVQPTIIVNKILRVL